MRSGRILKHALVMGVFLMTLIAAPAAGATGGGLDPSTRFYVPPADHAAHQQIVQLHAAHDDADAALLQAMVDTPQAVWFTSGTPHAVQQAVHQTVNQARAHRTMPVVVAYNVPGRDCAQYSAGGAADGAAYRAWIDGFAAGLRDDPAVVILEPDGLALLPTDCGQPDTYDRVSLISYAAHALLSDPNAHVYLDAGHSAWHAVGDMAVRLYNAGVLDVAGFVSNISNYRATDYETHFDTWVSQCLAFGTDPEEGGWRLGHFD